MKKYLNSVVAKFDTTQSGNAATGTTITVRDSSTGLRASLFSDNGVTALSNPFTVDNNGNYEFYVTDGRYNIIQDENLPTQLTLADVSIFDVSVSFGAPKTVTALTNNIFNFGVGSSLTVSGYASEGDGGQSVWLKTSDTDTAGQLPTIRLDGTLTDLRGAVWRIVPAGELDPRAVGFTGAGDNTAALTAACVAVGKGGKVKLDKSYDFELNGLDMPFLDIDFANSFVTSKTSGFGIVCNGAFSNQVGVMSVSDYTISVSSSSGYLVGDVVKITSTNEQPDFWSAGRYIGQFAVIVDIVGGIITVDRKIEDSSLYLTDVTLFKLDQNSVAIRNLTISPSPELSDHASLIEVRSLYKPIVENVNFINAKDTSIAYVSCYAYSHKNCSVRNSLDSAATGNFGYGIYDAGSDAGLVVNFMFNKGRHAFTNGGFTSSGGVDARCGYSTNCRVINGIARNATTGAWDTHPGFINITFENCEAYNSLNFGQVRSRNVQFINPYGKGLTSGISVAGGASGSTINPAKGVRIINADLEYLEAGVNYYEGDSFSLVDTADVYVEGGTFRPKGAFRGFVLEARNSPIKATFKNVSVVVSDSVDTDAAIFIGNYAGHEIIIDGMSFDGVANNGGQFAVVRGQASFGALQHEVEVQRVTYSGAGFENLDLYAAANVDVHINDIRVKSIGTGSLAAVVGGTSLTWGGAI